MQNIKGQLRKYTIRKNLPLHSAIVGALLTGLTTVVLMSCMQRTTKVSLPLDTPVAFSDSGAQQAPGRWWTAFEDTALNTLVNQALRSNFDLETAWQRLREAQAIVDRESSFLFPDLEAFLEGETGGRQEFETFETTEQLRLGLTSTYEVDLWGRIGSGVDAEQYRAQATLADYQTAVLSLSAEVVRTWYQLMEARDQMALLVEQIDTNEKVLNLLKSRFGSGQIRSVDILRQRQLLESTREQKIAVESEIQVLKHQLAVLLGRSPQEDIDYASTRLPELPPLPKTGLPVELVRRRPDVQSAYNQLLAADRDLAAAISNQYPRLTLSASIFSRSDDASNLFKDWAHSFAGNLLAPIFYGGRLGAEADRSEAVKMQRLYQYGQATLLAFQEVEDALIREKKQSERINSLEEQVSLARQSYEQLRVEYLNGVSDYIDVLTALTDEQQLRRDLLSAKLVLLEFRIALYRALAGGFETERDAEQS
nr:TolC family protein [Fodinibius sp.]NIW44317.1 efflux transporter outer membrane subunit [Gammaproteobacteria bacterium]NIX02317.1 efflux transporter outer membrane subunit [Phycisphaerae bacterium]NIY24775.1 efflux transporter outer membrane subunit [Fodinibius sp.]